MVTHVGRFGHDVDKSIVMANPTNIMASELFESHERLTFKIGGKGYYNQLSVVSRRITTTTCKVVDAH